MDGFEDHLGHANIHIRYSLFIHLTQIQIILLWRDQLLEILLVIFSHLNSDHTGKKEKKRALDVCGLLCEKF